MALTADRNTNMKDGELVSVPVKTNVKIYAGALVVASAGYAAPGSAALGLVYLGRAEEYVDNTGGADGAKSLLVRRGKAFKFGNKADDLVTEAERGALCFIVDDETVAKTDAGCTRSPAGIVVGVDADGVWIEAELVKELKAIATLDFPSIAAAASADLTIAVAGAAVNDPVSLGLPAAPTAGLIFQAFVSAAGTVTVRATNITAAPVDAASAAVRVTVIKA